MILNDHLLIDELAVCWNGVRLDKQRLLPIVTALADEAARHFQNVLEAAAGTYPNRHVATLFGKITLWRFGYRDWQRDGGEPALFPLERQLGWSAGPVRVCVPLAIDGR